MNFVGHLFVARWLRADSDFGFGAMLPDFAGMARVRLARSDHEGVAAGVALHHATDEVFHDSEPFIALIGSAFDALIAREVNRGPARAVAHVGVEMLIDGELLHNEALGEDYLHALGAFSTHIDALAPDSAGRARLALLAERLRQHGVPHDYRNIEAVTRRLDMMLAPRPRLALDANARAALVSVLPGIQETLKGRIQEIVDVLAASLRKAPVLVR